MAPTLEPLSLSCWFGWAECQWPWPAPELRLGLKFFEAMSKKDGKEQVVVVCWHVSCCSCGSNLFQNGYCMSDYFSLKALRCKQTRVLFTSPADLSRAYWQDLVELRRPASLSFLCNCPRLRLVHLAGSAPSGRQQGTGPKSVRLKSGRPPKKLPKCCAQSGTRQAPGAEVLA